MNYSVERFLKENIEMHEKGDWFIYDSARKRINQPFISSNDLVGMRSFYDSALENVSSLEVYKSLKTHEKKIGEILDGISSQAILSVEKALSGDKSIKSIYFEYNEKTIDAFFCTRFDKSSELWTESSVFNKEGPQIHQVFDFYDWGLASHEESVAREYFDALLLSEVVVGCRKPNASSLGFGFAEHDFEVINF
ncbi:hypothetical protein [Pseudoteredinibacter isoporae]|uniref:Uncharacterized protein n=1 Tax=Pseudoteredinibacter isoporae TaxID=570281 RepID=A0A7X0JPR5_9GAMM|nr:hypothetical protein [Pseudoteredinibacter isoporae]MBB6520010.1 hypothetical protein [Pseudoteredinibacter isoporae]NHO85582.1 hypothetical protein [Pseudoteredinibacter isoporae]NIB25966.1 hypothetical protein [Pseudoteredinibacter isoporae]